MNDDYARMAKLILSKRMCIGCRRTRPAKQMKMIRRGVYKGMWQCKECPDKKG